MGKLLNITKMGGLYMKEIMSIINQKVMGNPIKQMALIQ